MQLFKQPKPVLLLTFVELWNRFSHFGMRTLLVLYMVNALKFSEGMAFGIFAVYAALDKLGGIFGAYLADKLFGLRRAILLGGWIIAGGHLLLALGQFYPGLSCLIVGSTLFTTNIMGLVGHFYTPDDPKRTSGYTLFYMGINIGALLATLLCGFIAHAYGFEYGFGMAAIGMAIGNIALLQFAPLLQGKGEAPANVSRSKKFSLFPLLGVVALLSYTAFANETIALALLPWVAIALFFYLLPKITWETFRSSKIGIYLCAYIFFVIGEMQIPSSFVIFAERFGTHTLFGFPITSTMIMGINPMVIIFLGGLATLLYRTLKTPFWKLLVPFGLSALGFFSLAIGSSLTTAFPLSGLMLIVGLISFAEILVIPHAYSVCSKVSIERQDTRMMSLIPLGYALASTLGGNVSKFMTATSYASGFLLLGSFLAISGLALGLAHARKKKERRFT